MKTTLEIDKQLLDSARNILGTKSIRETVELGLRSVLRQEALERLANLAGSMDLDLTVPKLRAERKRRVPRASR